MSQFNAQQKIVLRTLVADSWERVTGSLIPVRLNFGRQYIIINDYSYVSDSY